MTFLDTYRDFFGLLSHSYYDHDFFGTHRKVQGAHGLCFSHSYRDRDFFGTHCKVQGAHGLCLSHSYRDCDFFGTHCKVQGAHGLCFVRVSRVDRGDEGGVGIAA